MTENFSSAQREHIFETHDVIDEQDKRVFESLATTGGYPQNVEEEQKESTLPMDESEKERVRVAYLT